MNVNELIKNYINETRNLRRVNDILNTINNKRGTKLSHYTAIESIDPQVLTGVNKRLCTEDLSGGNVREIRKAAIELEEKITNKVEGSILTDLTNIVERYIKTLTTEGCTLISDSDLIKRADGFLGLNGDEDIAECEWSTKITDEEIILHVKLHLAENNVTQEAIVEEDYRIKGKLPRGVGEIKEEVIEISSLSFDELRRYIILINTPELLTYFGLSDFFWKTTDLDSKQQNDIYNMCNRSKFVDGLILLLKDLKSISENSPYENYESLCGQLDRIEYNMDNDEAYFVISQNMLGDCDLYTTLINAIKHPWLDNLMSILTDVKKVVSYSATTITVTDTTNIEHGKLLTDVTEFIKSLSDLILVNNIVMILELVLQEPKPISLEYTKAEE